MQTRDVPVAVNAEPMWSEWMGTGLMVLIAIGMVLAILIILRRSRRPAEIEPVTQEGAVAAPTIADEPVPAAAPLEASPAALAVDFAEPQPAVDPLPPPAPATLAEPPAPLLVTPREEPPVASAPAAPTPVEDVTPPPAAPAVPIADTDDLTRIKGLGPKLALKLGELGITRYAQIADLTPEQARDLDTQLGAFRGRLDRDRWIEQAGYLARNDRDGFEAAFGKL